MSETKIAMPWKRSAYSMSWSRTIFDGGEVTSWMACEVLLRGNRHWHISCWNGVLGRIDGAIIIGEQEAKDKADQMLIDMGYRLLDDRIAILI